MAGRSTPRGRPVTFAQAPKVADPKTQRALDVVSQAVLELQARRRFDQFTDEEPGYVPASGGGVADFLAADGTWKSVVGSGAVDSVTGTAPIAASPTTGAVVVSLNADGVTDVYLRNSAGTSVIGRAANTTGDPADIVAGSDNQILGRSASTVQFAAASTFGVATGTGTLNTIAKWTSSTALGNSAVTDDGTTFAINVNKFTVIEANGNTLVAGTLDVTGDFKVNTNKFTVATSSGNTAVLGDFAVNTNKFTVAASTGNTLVAGTLDVTGDFKVNTNKFTVAASTGNTAVLGDFAVNTNKFTVAASTGNTLVAGTLDVTGDFKVNTNKFTVTASSGNTLVAGTFTVSPMTAGSVWFAGTAGLLTQDNARLFWDDTNKALTVTTNSTSSAVLAINASATTGAMSIKNTNASGPVDFYAVDSAGTAQMSWGYGNASYSDTARVGRGYVWRNTGKNFVFARTNTVDGFIDSSGRFGIGTLTALDTNSLLHVNSGTGGTASIAGSLVTVESSGTTYMTIKAATAQKGLLFSNSSGGGDGAILYDGISRGMQFNTANGTRFTITSTGAATLSSTLGVTGDFAVNTNKFNVTASNGNTTVAGTLGVTGDLAVNTNKFTVTASSGNAVVAGTLGVTGDFAVNTNKFTVTASSGNTVVAGTLSVNGNTTLGDTTADTTQINGSIAINDDGAAFSCTSTGTGSIAAYSCTGSGKTANVVIADYSAGPSFDTTAGGLSCTGISAIITATRSAGTNGQNNFAALFSASGAATNNVAIRTNAGSNWLNTSSGVTSIGYAAATAPGNMLDVNGAVQLTGNLTAGDATSDSHVVNGRFNLKDDFLTTDEIAPAQITANQDNYSPTGMATAVVLYLTSDAARDITGFATGVAGRHIWVYNGGTNNIVLKHKVTSSAANQIKGRGDADTTLTAGTGAHLFYSAASGNFWVVMTDTL